MIELEASPRTASGDWISLVPLAAFMYIAFLAPLF